MNAGSTTSRLPFRRKKKYTEFLMDLPSRKVVTRMQLHYLRDVRREWSINDLRDIVALSTAIPYCDVVVTDKKASGTAVNRARLDKEFDTVIPRSLKELSKMFF